MEQKKLTEQLKEIMDQMRTGDPEKVRAGLIMLRAGLMRLVLMIDEYLKREDEHGKKEH